MIKIQVKSGPVLKRLQSGQARMKNPVGLMKLLAFEIGNMVIRLFTVQGGIYGRAKWPALSPDNIGKIRYGTNLQGMKPRRKPGAKIKRFLPGDKPLMASRGFFQSFRVLKLSKDQLIYGSALQLLNGQDAKYIQYAGRGKKNPRMVMPLWNAPDTQARVRPLISRFMQEIFGK